MTEDERSAEQALIRAALSFDSVMAEFEGDMGSCGEHLDGLFTACDRLRKAREAAVRAPERHGISDWEKMSGDY